MRPSNRHKGVDLVAGTDKILRVYHRNQIHSRYLQHDLDNLDTACKKNLNRVQQEIYNVYYSEFLPLRESKNRAKCSDKRLNVRRGTKRFDLVGDGRVKQKCVFPFISNSRIPTKSPSIASLSDHSEITPLPSVFNQSKECRKQSQVKNVTNKSENKLVPLSVVLKIPETERSEFIGQWREEFDRRCPSVSSRVQESSPDIDEERLKTIKNAIALSSQLPADSNLRKNKRLRRSFLASLRKQSLVKKDNNIKGIRDLEESQNKDGRGEHCAKSPINFELNTDQVLDSTKMNKLSNNSNSSLKEFTENIKVASSMLKVPLYQSFPTSPADESYYSNSPDFFSEIGEEPSSYEDTDYDGSSYTYESGSSYWEYSDEDLSDA